MSKEFLAEEIRKISDSLDKIAEADVEETEVEETEDGEIDEAADDHNPDPSAAKPKTDKPAHEKPAEDPKIGTVGSDANADASVDDMMTHEKNPVKLEGSIAVKSLAQALGIQNTALFAAAFNALKQGKLPNNQAQIRELAIAFDKLLAADASTTGKVLNQLRRIHKAS